MTTLFATFLDNPIRSLLGSRLLSTLSHHQAAILTGRMKFFPRLMAAAVCGIADRRVHLRGDRVPARGGGVDPARAVQLDRDRVRVAGRTEGTRYGPRAAARPSRSPPKEDIPTAASRPDGGESPVGDGGAHREWGASVARETLRRSGRLFVLRLRPGRYEVRATERGGPRTVPQTVTIPAHTTVRQDVFIDVP